MKVVTSCYGRFWIFGQAYQLYRYGLLHKLIVDALKENCCSCMTTRTYVATWEMRPIEWVKVGHTWDDCGDRLVNFLHSLGTPTHWA